MARRTKVEKNLDKINEIIKTELSNVCTKFVGKKVSNELIDSLRDELTCILLVHKDEISLGNVDFLFYPTVEGTLFVKAIDHQTSLMIEESENGFQN